MPLYKCLVLVPAIVATVSLSAAVTGSLSGDGHVLTVDVSGEETFDPSLVTFDVTDIVKIGTGALTVFSDLSEWNGRIWISNGTYRATIPSALGDVTTGAGGAVEVSDGATLELSADGSVDSFTMPKKSFVIGGDGVDGRGAVVYNGVSAFTKASLGNDITLRSDALVVSEGDFHVYWNNSPTYIRLCGNILHLKPSASRNFILGYPNTPDPQGGRILVNGESLTFMNPGATLMGDGCVVLTNTATLELSSLYGDFSWAVDLSTGSRLRTKTKIPAGTLNVDVNVFGGLVSLGDPVVPLYYAYDQSGGSVGFKGRISGGGFELSRDARVTEAQFHLFNPQNDFTNGVTAASGINVYLWSNGALPSGGGTLVMNGGSLFLKSIEPYELPSARFDGAGTVVGGVGRWLDSLEKTGQGDLLYKSAVDGPQLLVRSGVVRLDATNRAKIAGLYEGSYAYRKNTRPDYTDFFGGKVFTTNSIAMGPMCSYDGTYALWNVSDIAGADTRAVIAYKGYLWNDADNPATWAFAGSEAACSRLDINGTTVYEQQYNIGGIKYIGHGVATLRPGANEFLYVVYVGGLSGGPNSWFTDGTAAAQGKWKPDFGLSVNRQGIDSLVVDDYEPLMDPGDGSVFTYAPLNSADVVRPGVDVPLNNLNGVLPTFDTLAFSPGAGMDLGGVMRYRVGTLKGLPIISGTEELHIESEWELDVADFHDSAKLVTPGRLSLADGTCVSIRQTRWFFKVATNRKYAIATATGGIAIGDVSVRSDSPDRVFELVVSDGGTVLNLVRRQKGLVVVVK